MHASHLSMFYLANTLEFGSLFIRTPSLFGSLLYTDVLFSLMSYFTYEVPKLPFESLQLCTHLSSVSAYLS